VLIYKRGKKPQIKQGGNALKESELVKLLKEAKCELRHHGKKHDAWYSPITDRNVYVPRHKKEIPNGTCARILKDAGLK